MFTANKVIIWVVTSLPDFTMKERGSFGSWSNEAINKVVVTPNNSADFAGKVSKNILQEVVEKILFISEMKDILTKYEELYSKNPASDETITCGTIPMTTLSETKQKKWIETPGKMDMKHRGAHQET
ncbi:hypothetical protein QE152_g22571 [Popillia japonica]|uniref:Uncharacterized protein n=1 Tax=Popillia japonica TaxID=7064 RepID=A0AAW1KJQ0_POPJA